MLNLKDYRARKNLYDTDTERFVSEKLWQALPKEINESQALEIFKRMLRPYLLIAAQIIHKLYYKFRIFMLMPHVFNSWL